MFLELSRVILTSFRGIVPLLRRSHVSKPGVYRRMTYYTFSNIFHRSEMLLCPKNTIHDKYYVLPGSDGTEMEKYILKILDIQFESI
jgi:hypothetical protein